MQNILSIDAVSDPAQALILQVDGKDVRLVEQKSISLQNIFSKENLEHLSQADNDSYDNDLEDQTDLEQEDEDTEDVGITPLSELLSSLESTWTNSVLIIPSLEHHSLNIELPFSNPKSINRIIDMQVQDLVPFDLSEFLLQHTSAIAPLNDESYDIHVNILPKKYIRSILQVCREVNFEPMIISTPTGVLGGAYYLAPDYLAQNSAIIYSQDDKHHLVVSFDGTVRSDRQIETVLPASSPDKQQQELFTHIKLSIASIERRYSKTVEVVYLMDSTLNSHALQQILGRKVERLSIGELIESIDQDGNIAALGSVFAQDTSPPLVLNNFRAREFSYGLQLKELFAGFRSLLPYIVSVILIGIVSLITVFFLREGRINRLQMAIKEQIYRVAPKIRTVEEGNEMQGLRRELSALNEQLKTFGSPSQRSPLDMLSEISDALPKTPGLELKELEIKGNSVTIKGYGPSYNSIERIKVALRKKKSISSRIKDTIKKAGKNRYQFTFEIKLYE